MRFASQTLALWISTAATSSSLFAPFVGATSFKRAAFVSARNFASQTRRFSSSTATNMARIALCQFKVSEDKDVNHKTASDYLNRASEQGAQLAVLPEIWNGPYATSAFQEYAEVLPNVGDSSAEESPSAQLLMENAKQTKMWIVGGSVPELDGDKIYNTCLVIDPQGNVVAKHRKVHLFDIDVPGGITFFESDTLSPGETMTVFDGGDDFGMVGVGICYDIRFPEYALLLGKKYQCKILIYPGAFNMTTGPAHWLLLQRARAVDNQCFVVTAAPARTPEPETPGKYPHYTSWGHSTVVAPWGDVVAAADEKETLLVVDLDMNKVDEMRQGIPTMNQKRTDMYTLKETE